MIRGRGRLLQGRDQRTIGDEVGMDSMDEDGRRWIWKHMSQATFEYDPFRGGFSLKLGRFIFDPYAGAFGDLFYVWRDESGQIGAIRSSWGRGGLPLRAI